MPYINGKRKSEKSKIKRRTTDGSLRRLGRNGEGKATGCGVEAPRNTGCCRQVCIPHLVMVLVALGRLVGHELQPPIYATFVGKHGVDAPEDFYSQQLQIRKVAWVNSVRGKTVCLLEYSVHEVLQGSNEKHTFSLFRE